MSKISYTLIHAYVYTPATQEIIILLKSNITIKINTLFEYYFECKHLKYI